jgi:hypothetical protein
MMKSWIVTAALVGACLTAPVAQASANTLFGGHIISTFDGHWNNNWNNTWDNNWDNNWHHRHHRHMFWKFFH